MKEAANCYTEVKFSKVQNGKLHGFQTVEHYTYWNKNPVKALYNYAIKGLMLHNLFTFFRLLILESKSIICSLKVKKKSPDYISLDFFTTL